MELLYNYVGIIRRKKEGLGMKKGFSLIETLVVVLIIGILTAVALPEYRRAVRKAEMARYITAVNALYSAMQVHLETYKTYAEDPDDLDISLSYATCGKKTETWGKFYECKGEVRYGVFNNGSNAQAGDPKMRYTKVLKDYKDNGVNFKAGEIVCFFKRESGMTLEEKICKSLGPGVKKTGSKWNFWVM